MSGTGADRKVSGSTVARASLGPPGSDPNQPGDSDKGLVANSCFDFLLIELVPMA